MTILLNLNTRQAWAEEREVSIRAGCLLLLAALGGGHALRREDFLDAFGYINLQSVDVAVSELRRAFGPIIKTMAGYGYRLADDVDVLLTW